MDNAKNFNVGLMIGRSKGLREGQEKARALIDEMRQAYEAGCVSDIEDIVDIVKDKFDLE